MYTALVTLADGVTLLSTNLKIR